MIVEDSAVVRTLLTHIISADPRLVVAAAVSSAEAAIAALPSVRPDVISMDIHLPGLDGLEATRRIMADHPTPIVVISASIDKASLASSMNALRAGALSVVEKPVGLTHRDYAPVSREICTQLVIMSQVAVVRRRVRARAPEAQIALRPAAAPRVMVCAASTGGPQALARLLAGLPADWSLPILLVQHMGAAFMPGFAAWLDSVSPQRVRLAETGTEMKPGTVYVAPGDRHLRLDSAERLAVSDAAPVGGQRPAATVLFTSVAERMGAAAIGVVLTGMGEDGGPGVQKLLAQGAAVIAEHESSAVVYGMPAAAVRHGALALPLDLIAPQLQRIVARSRASQ